MSIKIIKNSNVKLLSEVKFARQNNLQNNNPQPPTSSLIQVSLNAAGTTTTLGTSAVNIQIFNFLPSSLPYSYTEGLIKNLTVIATPTLPTHFKANGNSTVADRILVNPNNGTGTRIYFFHPTAKGGASWFVNGGKLLSLTDSLNFIPAGSTVSITRAGDSTLSTWYKNPSQWI